MVESLTRLSYTTLDVFTSTAYTGNPLAVVLIPSEHEKSLSQAQKQQIAIEFNYSETVFLYLPGTTLSSSANDGSYRAQIFTPKSELPFAGHPIIGTAVYIFTHLQKDRDGIILKLKAGDVDLKYDRAQATARAAIPHDFHEHSSRVSWSRVGENQPGLTGTDSKDGQLAKSTHAVVSITKGMNFLLVDMTSAPELLDRLKPRPDDILRAGDLDQNWPATLLAQLFFCMQPYQAGRITRVKQRMMGIGLEDPATGSASSALCCWLALNMSRDGCNDERTFIYELEQGVEMGRRSIIHCEVTVTSDGKAIENVVLGGQAVEVMSGSLKVPI